MPQISLKPTHAPIRAYTLALAQLSNIGATHETAVREAWHHLIEDCAAPLKWTLVREYTITRKNAAPIRPDAVLLDDYRIPHGVIESKDDNDDLAAEMRAKLKLGYPSKNTIFWQPRRAILVQNGKVVLDTPLDSPPDTAPEKLCEILQTFFAYTEPIIADWERATEEFRDQVAALGRSLAEVIHRARGITGTGLTGVAPNAKFTTAFNDFAALCRAAINPALSDAAIEEMLIQHLLTARLFGTVFNNPDFIHRNIIATEIEKVIDALASGHFSRADFLKKLDRFYLAIENAATTIEDFSEKQKFLNTVYEKFFQGFAVKVADTMGIVYTPPAIVRFMLASIQDLLRTEFATDLSAPGVHILDPFTGTGNFLVHLMRDMPPAALKKKYATEFWANEIMLLPYYIAAQNIEHEYFEKTGTFEPFPGICLVDTFELAEPRQTEFEYFIPANTDRVNAQKKAPLRVILGNPPYNASQTSENDNNKNRKYPHLDRRIKNTYSAESVATLRNKLSDPYIKAIRWASDRLGEEGIIAYVSNNSYIDDIQFDGMRKCLIGDFDEIYIIDLGGDVRGKQPGTGNVFGITVGVSISLFVRRRQKKLKGRKAVIHYFNVPADWTAAKKLQWLSKAPLLKNIRYRRLRPDARETWLNQDEEGSFFRFPSIGSKQTRALNSLDAKTIFRTYSLGISTNRDAVAYCFDKSRLLGKVSSFCEAFNSELDRWKRAKKPSDIDAFVDYSKLKWSRNLKRELARERYIEFDGSHARIALWRPFTKRWIYLADYVVDEAGTTKTFFPDDAVENIAFAVSDIGFRAGYSVLATKQVPDLHLCASQDGYQCFPLYTYDNGDGHPRDNITHWALAQFRARYPKLKITKKDIFHYVYAILHHPAYREKYAANLRRELPRIPLAPDFAALAKAGEKLATLHTAYETQKEYKLKRIETPGVRPNYRVERMKLTKDKTALVYNDWLTLENIPPAAHDYRLGNRSALEWIIDQYQVTRDKQNPDHILADPNRPDDEEHILRLIGQIITVSVETMNTIRALPSLPP